MSGKARRTFHALGDIWWWLIILQFTYHTKKTEVEPNLTLSCEASQRGAQDFEQASNLGTVMGCW